MKAKKKKKSMVKRLLSKAWMGNAIICYSCKAFFTLN